MNSMMPNSIPGTPSFPPRGITWPMVAYAFVREMTSMLIVVAGAVIAVILAEHQALPYAALTLGANTFVTLLHRSKPTEPLDLRGFGGS